MPDDEDKRNGTNGMTAAEWWALVFMVVCILALVVVYLDVNHWRA